MLRRGIGLLICVLGALSLPLCASAHVAGPESSGATPCESLINWKSVQFPTAPPVPGGQDVTVQGGPFRLYARAYESKVVGTHPVLVVVLHGDGPPPYQFPNYQYAFASEVAAENENVVAVGLLRPGYTDPQGHHSQGCSGQRDGDNWGMQDTDSIADAIADLKRRYKARDVVVAGHSGGAAIAANILGRRPKLIDAALLVSCPCGDVNRWRSDMLKHTGFSVFDGNIQSLSPIDQVASIDPQVPVVMMTGTDDHVAPLAVAEQFRAAAAKAGKNVTLIRLAGRPHNTFLYPKVFAELGDIIRRVQGLDVQRTAAAKTSRTGACPIAIYQLNDGSKLDVGQSRGDHLRWSKEDGTTGLLTKGENGTWISTLGWTGRPDGKRVSFDCDKDTIDFAGITGKQIPLDVANVTFEGAGVQLAGRLVLPQGTGRVPIVILVHGSEHDSALKFYSLQRQLPADGIGVFVYDKRGTGKSGGTYTQNYLLLADDAIAAMNEAKRLARTRAGRIGYQGGSQGGWVAPLAAKIAPVDFVIVGFGLAVSPLDEVREATAFDLTSRGYGPDVVAKAMHIADAVSAVIVSDFQSGYDQLDAVKAKYSKEPWFKYVRGDIAFYLLETPEAKLREHGPKLLAGVPANYDPMPVLRNLDTPQLWILAADDHDAPSAETARRLRALQAKGKPITVTVFPHTEHGIYEFETKPDGTRVDTRNPEGYFAMMRDFILHGRLDTQRYGDSTIFRPAAPP